MSYRVLARAYRSGTFDQVVGQDAIATTLRNAIATNRVHHGYLFTGTRGVGKTSMARILAKALNCLSVDGPTITPCGTCDSCTAIAVGEDVDVVEIDAASNTGVDNIRELRSNATLRPARSRFKIYIIDEVHMLSSGAFNALLKTLEEPPSHVKFILATTEDQKVPATIQSRCQRFDFRAIDVDHIAAHLAEIVKAEEIRVDEEVLRRVARLANGSMRDALSLLDKLLSFESKHLTAAAVEEMLPPPHDELAFEVMARVAEQDGAGALQVFDRALQSGRTVERFCDHLIEHVRTLMLLRICGAETELVDVSAAMRPKLAEQAGHFDGPTFVFIITLLEELRRNVKFSGAARALADAALVRLAMSRQFTDLGDLITRLEGNGRTAASPPPGGDVKKNDRVSDQRPSTALTHERPAPVARSAPSASPAGARPARAVPVIPAAPMATGTGQHDAPASANGPPPATTARPVPAWEQATRDPLVQRVKEVVDGVIRNVRPRDQLATSATVEDDAGDETAPEPTGELFEHEEE